MDSRPNRMRLFVGGLHEDVTETDLSQRFDRFGSVASVDVRTKRDSQGLAVNVFAYLDIDISEANFKKCLSIYHDAKWKGRTMKVQVAKENFLTRLAKERKEVQENPESVKPAASKVRKTKEREAAKVRLEENMKKAGVEDFLMKKAVPGTPIPGEQNWIVAKFGRVLPIMHMQRKDKRSKMTCDPSKYVHHVRKFKDDAKSDQMMSEFPVENLTWHLPEAASDMDRKRMGEFPEYFHKKKPKINRQGVTLTDDDSKRRRLHPLENGDEQKLRQERFAKPDEHDFEVVGQKYDRTTDSRKTHSVKSESFTGQIRTSKEADRSRSAKQDQHGHTNSDGVEDLLEQCRLESEEDSCGSADTDDICQSARKASKPEAGKQKFLTDWAKEYYNKERMAAMSGDTEEFQDSRREDSATGLKKHSTSQLVEANNRIDIKPYEKRTSGISQGTKKEERSKAKESIQGSAVNLEEEDGDASSEEGSEEEEEEQDEEEDDVEEEEEKSEDDDDDSDTEEDEENEDMARSNNDQNSIEEDAHSRHNHGKYMNKSLKEDFRTRSDEDQDGSGDDEDTDFRGVNNEDDVGGGGGDDDDNISDEHSSSEDSTNTTGFSDSSDANNKTKSPEKQPSSRDSGFSSASKDAQFTPGDSAGSRSRQRQSDKVRLESVKKRQAAILTQKAAVQEALKAIDSKDGSQSAGRHVRFDSDDDSTEVESGAKDEADKTKMEAPSKRLPGLFDSDEDEEEMAIGSEADDDRFKIKPQFQGKAGEKLLKLQDRIGMDSRFKLGEMFLEDEDDSDSANEEDLDLKTEKQRSLSVLEGIVGSHAMHSVKSKTTSNFRDPSSVRYDPTREDHAHFEISDASVENGQSLKKTDRAIEDTVPEVSKDRYYEVGDLAFGNDKEDTKPFSFFGNDESETEKDDKGDEGFSSLQKDILASTTLGKRQLTLDSSDSESEEEEARHSGKEDGEETAMDVSSSNWPTSAHGAFFFLPDDVRLKTGPEQFCRKLSLEGMNQWFEEQKAELQGEYKKRHQRALRDSKKAAQQGGKKQRR